MKVFHTEGDGGGSTPFHALIIRRSMVSPPKCPYILEGLTKGATKNVHSLNAENRKSRGCLDQIPSKLRCEKCARENRRYPIPTKVFVAFCRLTNGLKKTKGSERDSKMLCKIHRRKVTQNSIPEPIECTRALDLWAMQKQVNYEIPTQYMEKSYTGLS